MNPQVSIKKKLFRKLRKFSAKSIENMISLSRSLSLVKEDHKNNEKVGDNNMNEITTWTRKDVDYDLDKGRWMENG